MKTIRKTVCAECYTDYQPEGCVCTESRGKIETIKLDFDVCECCNREYPLPSSNEYNRKAIKFEGNEHG